MTGWTCRRFRARFTPGTPADNDSHRRRCQVCAEYAAALERAATRLPLPDRLRARLEAIPTRPASGSPVVRFPLPEIPMPDRLRGRLQGIARSEARVERTLPDWIRSPRYAIAASYLLAALMYAAFGNPVEPLERVAHSLASESRQRLETLEAETSKTYGETRRVFETSLHSLGAEVTELSEKLESTLERRP
ncbi:MAG TPA: hypothetical protein VMW27_23855 [Thermoanaerobaculia bacterium]|nr:hypothetical protein [Thermoanaerobaculia bacterium]